ncbi:dUTP diphosphatase [Spiroplasma endosymbiont of Aspidapion aeneum]|uniref:dUTP diphosphatase n=1 Tax=Spiroplasma endosymbiont of Aspidapion aeneum TaxID=3066276 RepID=UPI00313BC791
MIDFKTLEKIRCKQKELDAFLLKGQDTNSVELKEKRVLAFIVELCEFLNEEKSFKYWKKDKTIAREKLVEEYIDGIHFLMSLINEQNLDFNNYKIKDNKHEKFHIISLSIVENAARYSHTRKIEDLWKFVDLYLSLTSHIDLEEDELFDIYDKKNKINIDRSNNGY